MNVRSQPQNPCRLSLAFRATYVGPQSASTGRHRSISERRAPLPRCPQSARALHSNSSPPHPEGLYFTPSFIDAARRDDLLVRTLALYEQIEAKAVVAQQTAARTYLSKQHNLKSDEYYKRVRVADEQKAGTPCLTRMDRTHADGCVD